MSLRALICAGQPHFARALALHLVRAQVDVWTAGDREHALDRLAQLHPDVVVVDVDMPCLTGWEVIAAAEAHIVALTARSLDDVTRESQARGLMVDEVLLTPFSPRQLRSRITAWGKLSTAVAAQ